MEENFHIKIFIKKLNCYLKIIRKIVLIIILIDIDIIYLRNCTLVHTSAILYSLIMLIVSWRKCTFFFIVIYESFNIICLPYILRARQYI